MKPLQQRRPIHSAFRFAAAAAACLALAAPGAHAQSPLAAPPGEPSPFGVNFLKWEFLKKNPDAFDDLARRIAIMKEAGVYWDRDGIDRKTVHPAPGVWDWSYTDRVVALCRQNHIHLAVILMGGGPPRDDADRADYAEYVFRTVDRYKGSIKVWEIWNEPNIPSFWKNPDAHLYTLLLKAAYASAKRADPDCVVLGGSANGPGADWFDRIAAEGGWDACDAISFHPYAMSPNPIKQRLDLILRTMRAMNARHSAAAGASPKPMWITEDGWRAGRDARSEAEQAAKVFQTYVIALSNGVANVDYFCMDDYDHWGLVRSIKPFTPKPSFPALQMLTRALGSPGPAGRFLGYLPGMPPGVAAHVFGAAGGGDGSGDGRVICLWSLDDADHAVNLGQEDGLTAANVLGQAVSVANGRLTVGKMPVLVTGARASGIGMPDPSADPYVIPKGAELLFNGALDAAKDSATGSWKDPGDWHRGVFNAGGTDATFDVDTTGRGGSTCVSIAGSKGKAAWNASIIPVEPEKRYRLTAWIRAKNATGENDARIVWYSGNMWTPVGSVQTESVTGTGDWRQVTISGVAPQNATFVRVHLESDADTAGAVWFDDVSLVEE